MRLGEAKKMSETPSKQFKKRSCPRKLKGSLDSIDSPRVIHHQISKNHLYIVTEEEHDD